MSDSSLRTDSSALAALGDDTPTFGVREMLAALHKMRACEPIDMQLAETCVRRSDESGNGAMAVALATVIASRARREGHSAVTLAQLARQGRAAMAIVAASMTAERVRTTVALPEGDEEWWGAALAGSALVSDGTVITPLVLRDRVLQFRRYYDAERRIASAVARLVRTPVATGGAAFSIITGGPGTGKTTRVAELLVDLSVTQPGLRVSLAAPTGKAAARLTESIRHRLDVLAEQNGRRAPFPGEARTVHRLLGYSPQADTFRSNQHDPLDDDLVIVDEASMVDALLLDGLLRALKPGARLMLVGDHNQLASVDAGDVLGALCRSALAAPVGTPLRESVSWLTTSWRFAAHPAIGTLAAAILAGDADEVLHVCSDPLTTDIQQRPPAPSTDALLEPIVEQLERCLTATSPWELLNALDAFRILAPEREGRMGVNGINAAVERWLARRGHAVSDFWYHRRPVMVTANDYNTGVFNGDVGVVWREGGRVAVHFRTNDGTIRAIAPVRLPMSETAWAMTVHKSQGSEFDTVMVVIPEYESRIMSRELLYTAATRARQGVSLVGSPDAIRAAIARGTERTSGLEGRVREAMGREH